MSVQERLDIITWFGVFIVSINLGALVGIAVWYWHGGRK